MEIWLLITITLCIAFFLKASHSLFSTTIKHQETKRPLPPGPKFNILSWLGNSFSDIESLLGSLRSKFGPIVTIQVGSRPSIFILDRFIAHQALIKSGPLFANRIKASSIGKIISCNQHNITSASYGSTWRILRGNLSSEILHQSRIKSYSHARNWVLDVLIYHLQSDSREVSDDGGSRVVTVIDHFRYAMFCLLLFMCFGEKFADENLIKRIEDAQHRLLFSFGRLQILNFYPFITKILLRHRWNEFYDMVNNQRHLLFPLIRARKHKITKNEDRDLAYVDTLLQLELEEEKEQELGSNLGSMKEAKQKQDMDNSTGRRIKRKLTEEEVACLCSEFLDAGTDTTSTTLQWIMANLVKHQGIQDKLVEEIKGIVGSSNDHHHVQQQQLIKEEDLAKMTYLKAIILETLRLHPPGHFLLPHAVTATPAGENEFELNGYTIPKNASINVLLVDVGRDPEVWEDPMKFKPERFLKVSTEGAHELDPEFDITGTKEIKMMPFGVGRRICPGSNLAMLHLEYFVANLVWKFNWSVDDEVDMSESRQFTIVMKNPLRARISPRFK